MVYYVYLIKTVKGFLNKSYVGYTNNFNKRLDNHNKNKGAKSTKGYKWVEENYGKSGVPKWNFYKVLINKTGKIEEVYGSITNPSSKKIVNKINSILQ